MRNPFNSSFSFRFRTQFGLTREKDKRPAGKAGQSLKNAIQRVEVALPPQGRRRVIVALQQGAGRVCARCGGGSRGDSHAAAEARTRVSRCGGGCAGRASGGGIVALLVFQAATQRPADSVAAGVAAGCLADALAAPVSSAESPAHDCWRRRWPLRTIVLDAGVLRSRTAATSRDLRIPRHRGNEEYHVLDDQRAAVLGKSEVNGAAGESDLFAGRFENLIGGTFTRHGHGQNASLRTGRNSQAAGTGGSSVTPAKRKKTGTRRREAAKNVIDGFLRWPGEDSACISQRPEDRRG